MKRHLLLTGDKQVGKTTLISRLLARHPGWNIKGYRTWTDFSAGDGARGFVYIMPAARSDWYRKDEALVGIRGDGARESFPAVFDQTGARILAESRNADLVLMDELGFMENEAPAFQRAVLKALQDHTPVLGVIKPASTPFLDELRDDPGVRILTVNRDSREQMLLEADAFVTHAVGRWQAERGRLSQHATILRKQSG